MNKENFLRNKSDAQLAVKSAAASGVATRRRLRSVWARIAASALLFAASTVSAVNTCPFDNGGSDAVNDGLVLTRYALGLTGAPLVASTRYASLNPATVKANIECVGCALDMNGDGNVDAVDATIIARHLSGFQGASLTAGLALGTGTRNSAAAVQSFLAIGCNMTGGTVTSIIAGTGLTGGTITTSGTINADTTYLQRRVSSACAVGTYIRAIQADGSVTCGPDGVGEFADFYALGYSRSVVPGAAVQFPQNGPSSLGSIMRFSSSEFGLLAVGTYQVMFQVSVNEPGQLVLSLNGTPLPWTAVGRVANSSQIVGIALVTTTAPNSFLSVINPVANTVALTVDAFAGGSQQVSAHLVITRLR